MLTSRRLLTKLWGPAITSCCPRQPLTHDFVDHLLDNLMRGIQEQG
jgi:hypothetical protein